MYNAFKYSDWWKSENIKKYEISNVKKYCLDLESIASNIPYKRFGTLET